MDCGLFCRGGVMLDRFGLVVARRGKVRHVKETKLVQARGRINAGGLG